MNFTYEISGFARDAAYSAYLSTVIKEYENSFHGIKNLHLVIKELSHFQLDNPKKETTKLSDNSSRLEITFPIWKRYDNHGKVTSISSPYDFFQALRGAFERAVKAHESIVRGSQ